MGILLDILLIAILLISIVLGYKKGLINVAFNLCAFIIALIITLVLYKPITNFVIDNTEFDEKIESVIIEKGLSNDEKNTTEDGTLNKYIEEFYYYDELYLFSEYKINNLQSILNNHKIRCYDQSRYKLFDMRFNTDSKESILKGRVNPLFDNLVKRIEKEKTPTYSLRILELLNLDYRSQEYIYTQIQLGKQRYLQNKEPIITEICIEEDGESNEQYIVLGMTDKKNQVDALKGVLVVGNEYKNKNYNSDVLGILIDIEEEQEKIIEFTKIQKIGDVGHKIKTAE